jgi:hypothetical protein
LATANDGGQILINRKNLRFIRRSLGGRAASLQQRGFAE